MKTLKVKRGGANAYGVTREKMSAINYKLGFDPSNKNSNEARLRRARFEAAKQGLDPNSVSRKSRMRKSRRMKNTRKH